MSVTSRSNDERIQREVEEENAGVDWRSPEYRAARMVWEPDDVEWVGPKEGNWNLTLTDGSTIILVQTPEQLDMWLHEQGVSLNDLKTSPVWQNVPEAILEAVG